MFRYLALIFSVLSIVGCTEQVKLDVAGVGETMPPGLTAITWDGKNLIVGKEGLIAFIDNIDTATAGSIYNYEGHYFLDRYPITITSKENPTYITALAWQKTYGNTGYIWAADAANKRLLKITPQGDVVRQFSLSAIYPEDMTFDGEYLWIADSKRKKIFKVSTEDGSPVEEYLSPVAFPNAIAWDGKNLIIAGIIDPINPSSSPDNVRIIRLNTATGKVIEEIPNSRYLSSPAGMAWINGKLWISDRNTGNIVIISDWGTPSADEKNYKLGKVSSTFKKVQVKEEKKQNEEAIDEAKRAAEEAKKAAEEAKRSAEEAKKAFELQQKK